MSMPIPSIYESGKFDPSNPLHQQSARAFYDNLQTMTAQNGGDQTAAMQLYKDTQAKYGFSDAEFAGPLGAQLVGHSGEALHFVVSWHGKSNPMQDCQGWE